MLLLSVCFMSILSPGDYLKLMGCETVLNHYYSYKCTKIGKTKWISKLIRYKVYNGFYEFGILSESILS